MIMITVTINFFPIGLATLGNNVYICHMKEEYIKLRTQNDMPVSWFYRYFTSKSKVKIHFDHFHMFFMNGDIHEIMNYLDKQFDLTVVIGKNGSVIKVVQ